MNRTLDAAAILVFGIATACGGASIAGGDGASVSSVFRSRRPADTIDAAGPYTILLERVAGAAIASGKLLATVERKDGTRVALEAPLEVDPAGTSARARLPGQPHGSSVRYHFELETEEGIELRHPRSAEARYAFRVQELLLDALAIDPRSDRVIVRATVRAAGEPRGELVLRRLSYAASPKEERHELEGRIGSAAGAHELVAEIPALAPGECADFFLELKALGEVHSLPADAPRRVFSIKEPALAVSALDGDESFTACVAFAPGARWLGTLGGGLLRVSADGARKRLTLVDGLPSNEVDFVVVDGPEERVFAGTKRGVVEVDEAGAMCAVRRPEGSAWDEPADESAAGQAGPGALSPLDGSLLFQMQARGAFEQVHPLSELWLLENGVLRRIRPPDEGGALLGFSAIAFDELNGEWLLGGFVEDASRLRPVVVRWNGERWGRLPLQPSRVGERELTPERIEAFAREPGTGALLAALEITLSPAPGATTRAFGLLRIDEEDGALAQVVPELVATERPIADLATDWRAGRVLVASMDRGLCALRGGILERLDPDAERVTALALESDRILAGTPGGAFELAGGTKVWSSHADGKPRIPRDALPMEARAGRVLLSSYSSGVLELEPGSAGAWQLARAWRPGIELPAGLFGDACYAGEDALAVIVLSQGVCRFGRQGESLLLEPEDGLASPHLLRLLGRSDGELWLAHAPLPVGGLAGGGVQRIVAAGVLPTAALGDRSVGTIGRWVELPERGIVLAATAAGVLAFDGEGRYERLTTQSTSSLARDPNRGLVAAVGSAVSRFEGGRFVPVLFRLENPRSRGAFVAGNPLDVAIDGAGRLALLYSEGVLAILGPEGEFQHLLTPEDGIPPTARRLLLEPRTGHLFVGSSREGLAIVALESG